MKKETLKISPRYIIDSSGNKTEVILDVSTFEKMLEALEEGEFIDFNEENKKILIPIIGHRKEVYDIAKRLHLQSSP